MSGYIVRRPHCDFAGNHRRKGEPAAYDAKAHARGDIATPAEIEAERQAQAERAATATYEPHYYQR